MTRTIPLLVLFFGALATACDQADEPIVKPEPLVGDWHFDYPVALWDEQVDGETLLSVFVTTDGSVDSVRVQTSSGYPEFDEAAVEGAWNVRFIPAYKGNKKMPMWVRLPVRFDHVTGSPDRSIARPNTAPEEST
jgi:TonB family protein